MESFYGSRMSTTAFGNSGNECDWNLAGAQYIRELMIQLGFKEESTFISGTGGGTKVPKAVASAVGSAILKALREGRIYESYVKDILFGGEGQKRIIPMVLDKKLSEKEFFCANLNNSVTKLDEEAKIWIKEIGTFFVESQGFTQE